MTRTAAKTSEQRRLDILIDTYEICRLLAEKAWIGDYPESRKALDKAEHRLAIALLAYRKGYQHGAWVYATSRSTGELVRQAAPKPITDMFPRN